MIKTIEMLKHFDSTVYIPKYDKSLRQGRGDRMNKENWNQITGFVINI